ncbi:hypothetical protein, partial [Rhodospirillum rubrum]|uniref:hypothetical protein n=1 Tax=Rhodospirillum rubrum TaxID=1085 RepID=UPI001F5C0101
MINQPALIVWRESVTTLGMDSIPSVQRAGVVSPGILADALTGVWAAVVDGAGGAGQGIGQ